MRANAFDTFIKLMQRSTSANDHEALTALRTAYRVLTDNGYTWEMLLRKRITVLSEVETADPVDVGEQPGPLDDADFDMALRGASGGFRDTLLSIQEQWDEGAGQLSPRQVNVVRAAAERAAARHPGGRFK